MKIKNDYITNSSSASFILYITSTIQDLGEFKKFLYEYIIKELKWDGAGSQYPEDHQPNIFEISTGVYKVEEYVCMFNGYGDIPSWMVDIMIRQSFIGGEDRINDPHQVLSARFEIEEE